MECAFKIITLFIYVNLAVLLLNYPSGATENQVPVVNFVFYNPDSPGENPKVAVTALTTFSNYLETRLDCKIKINYFVRERDLEKFMATHTVHFGVLSNFYFVKNYKRLKATPMCVSNVDGSPFYRLVLLVRKDAGIESLFDLKGKCFTYTALSEENIPFLNQVVFRNQIEINSFFSTLNQTTNSSSAALAVMYKNCDAAAVYLLAYNSLRELNPQINKVLKVVYTSPKFPAPPFVYFQGSLKPEQEKIVSEMKRELLHMHETPLGQQTLLPFKVLGWLEGKMDYFRDMEQYFASVREAEKSEKPNTTVGSTPSQNRAIKKLQSRRFFDKKHNTLEVRYTLPEGFELARIRSVSLDWSIDNQQQQRLSHPTPDNRAITFSLPLKKPQKTEGVSSVKPSVYIVKKGDTLSKLARRFLGSAKKYPVLWKLNGLKNPHLIFVGQKLKIKSLSFIGQELSFTLIITMKDGTEIKGTPAFEVVTYE